MGSRPSIRNCMWHRVPHRFEYRLRQLPHPSRTNGSHPPARYLPSRWHWIAGPRGRFHTWLIDRRQSSSELSGRPLGDRPSTAPTRCRRNGRSATRAVGSRLRASSPSVPTSGTTFAQDHLTTVHRGFRAAPAPRSTQGSARARSVRAAGWSRSPSARRPTAPTLLRGRSLIAPRCRNGPVAAGP
jgi:hypothetical protein